jgi:WD40 repeat protein
MLTAEPSPAGSDFRPQLEAVALVPEQTYVVAIYSDSVIRIWDTGKSEIVRQVAAPANGAGRARNLQRLVRDRGWSASGLARASGLTTQRVREILQEQIHGAEQERLENALRSYGLPVSMLRNTHFNSVHVSQDGKRLLTAAPDGKSRTANEPADSADDVGMIQVWDLERIMQGEDLANSLLQSWAMPLPDKSGSIARLEAARFLPGGHDKVMTIEGNLARLWKQDQDNREWSEEHRYGPHTAVTSATATPCGQWIATGSWDGLVKLWNSAGHVVAQREHPAGVNSVQFTQVNGQLNLLTSCDDGRARLWLVDVVDGQATMSETAAGEFTRDDQVAVTNALAFPNAMQLLTTYADGSVAVWNTVQAAGVLAHKPQTIWQAHSHPIISAAVARDGSMIVTGSSDNEARIWQADGAPLIRQDNIQYGEGNNEPRQVVLRHIAPVTAVAISPDRKRIFTGSETGVIQVWDAETGRELISLTGHARAVTSIACETRNWSGGGRLLTSSLDGSAVLWEAEPWGRFQQTLSPHAAISGNVPTRQ